MERLYLFLYDLFATYIWMYELMFELWKYNEEEIYTMVWWAMAILWLYNSINNLQCEKCHLELLDCIFNLMV